MSFFDDASLVFLPSGQAGKDGKAYSMKPTDGSGDFTFSRGSNLTATRVDSNGLIEKGRENLLTYSNDFSQWGTSNASVTSGQSGYDGSTDAWLLSKSDANGYIQGTSITYSVNTISVYAKAADSNWIWIAVGGGFFSGYFDLLNGQTGTLSGAAGGVGIDIKIEDVGNGWYRCSVTGQLSSTQGYRIYIAEANGDKSSSSGSIYIQDAQVEAGLVATEYIESGATTGKAGILEDSPRFDYSGGASCPSLLLEPSRTNLIGYSEYLGGTGWTAQAGITLTPNTTETLSPEGLNNAYKVVSTDATKGFYISGLNVTNDAVRTIYLKGSVGGETIVFKDPSGFGTPSTKTLTTDWQRFEMATTNDGNTYQGLFIDDISVGTIYAFGAQVEEGSYPTSYIPNHSGGSVTRNADSSTLSSIINGDAAFTFMIESGVQDYGISVPKYFDAGALGYINHNISNTLRYRFGGSNYVQSISGLDSFKFLLRYDRSEIKVYFNGSLEHTISASLSGSIGLSLLGGLNKQVLLFPTDLPDNQCIALTS